MISMEVVTFAIGVAIGVVFASVCVTASFMYDEYCREKKRMGR